MMLPPLDSFPREGLVFNMAADACLTARKQLEYYTQYVRRFYKHVKYTRQRVDPHGVHKDFRSGICQQICSSNSSLIGKQG